MRRVENDSKVADQYAGQRGWFKRKGITGKKKKERARDSRKKSLKEKEVNFTGGKDRSIHVMGKGREEKKELATSEAWGREKSVQGSRE